MLMRLVTLVYDISQYTELHPGGVQILRGVGGTNASTAFHEVDHSEDAHATLQTFLVGTLEASEEARVRPVYTSTVVLPTSTGKNGGFHGYILISKTLVQRAIVLACMLVAAKFLRPEMVDTAALSKAAGKVPLFWRGVLVSSAVSGACFWTVGKEIGKSLDMTKDLRRYPPVMTPTQALRGPAKITRQSNPAIDPVHFCPLTLSQRTQLTPDTYKFTLSVQDAHSKALSSLSPGWHVQVRARVESELVTRSYTPTHTDAETGRMDLTIKVYAHSKMGNHLLSLPLDAPVEVRGPIGSFKNYHRFLCSDLAMIAGGTGITPMWQLIQAVCADSSDHTRITLLYATRTQGDILLRDEIDALAASFPAKLTVHYFVGTATGEGVARWAGKCGKITKDTLAELLPAVGRTSKYLLCGPDPMVQQITQDLAALGCDGPKAFKHATDQVFVF
jgi:cytochrome-b5 reductase